MHTTTFNKPKTKNCNPDFEKRQQNFSERKTVPKVNIFAKSDRWEISLSLPGYLKEDIRLSVENNLLKITGSAEAKNEKYNRKEWSLDSFEQSFRLPENVNETNIEAEMKNGILSIFLYKSEPNVSKIDIK
jgi:HSP20 family protein